MFETNIHVNYARFIGSNVTCDIYMAIMCTVIHMFHELTTRVE